MDAATRHTLLFGLIGACILLIPEFGYYYDFSFPGMGFIWLFSTGAGYMKTFFHELGHCVFFLLYGYLSVPMFDTVYGGGFTKPITNQSYLIMLAVSGFIAYTAYLNRENKLWCGLFVLLLIFQLATGFTEFHTAVWLFMGHGSELVIASFMLWRALMDMAPRGIGERWANALFGFYFLLSDTRSFWGLMFNDVERYAYALQKGGMHIGDFSRIAQDVFNTDVASVAAFAMGCTVVALTVPFVLFFCNKDDYFV